jgi:hypothetical protein
MYGWHMGADHTIHNTHSCKFGISHHLPHLVRHFKPQHPQKKGFVAKSGKMAGCLIAYSSLISSPNYLM